MDEYTGEWKVKSAFPRQGGAGAQLDSGMSLRDWFAGQHLAANQWNGHPASLIAKWCYQMADAMLEARKK